MFLNFLEVFVLNLESLLDTLLGYCITYGGRLLMAAIVLILGFWLCRIASKRIRRKMTSSHMDRSVLSILLRLLSLVFKTILVITAISIMGVPMSSVITVIATVGAAIGLALQGSLANLAGGIMLLIFKPFRVDSFISVQDNVGTVTEIGLFYTVLRTPDHKRVTLPNGALMNSTVINYNSYETIRVDLTVGVAYGSDIDRVRSVLLSVADGHPLVMDDPAPIVHMTNHDDSALTFVLRSWCRSEDYWTVQWELRETVERAFGKAGIEIPFPQVDVHIKDTGSAEHGTGL